MDCLSYRKSPLIARARWYGISPGIGVPLQSLYGAELDEAVPNFLKRKSYTTVLGAAVYYRLPMRKLLVNNLVIGQDESSLVLRKG
jgi:hypothetical protein